MRNYFIIGLMSSLGGGSGELIHTLHTREGDVFDIAISPAPFATAALILVHGFGVQRDSRGLFTDLTAAVSDKATTICGDFSNVEPGLTRAVPLSQQAERLKTVMDFSRHELDVERSVQIGHSQGSLVVALAHQPNDAVLLAPPLGNAYENFIATSGWTKRGSRLDLQGESILIRSDGSRILVPKEFWDDFRALGNVNPLLQRLADESFATIYFAGADSILGEQETPEGIKSKTIPGANHDFAPPARGNLISTLLQDLGL